MSTDGMKTLAALSRWRRQERTGPDAVWPLWGYARYFGTWTNDRDGHRVQVDVADFEDGSTVTAIKVVRLGEHSWDHQDRSPWIEVESAQHALDILVAYGVIPPQFSSAFRSAAGDVAAELVAHANEVRELAQCTSRPALRYRAAGLEEAAVLVRQRAAGGAR